MAVKQFDLVVIGGGIIGLATAMRLLQNRPPLKIAVLEKESSLACHQSGRNSGVIHSGIYYKPGSLKARACVQGRRALIDFCDRHGVPYKICGKVIVALSPEELPRLEELARRGTANGLRGLEIVGPKRLREIEPRARGVKALYVPETGVVDFHQVAQAFAANVQDLQGEILTLHEVRTIRSKETESVLETSSGDVRARHVINCAGLFSDHLARTMPGAAPFQPPGNEEIRILPFRGDFYRLVPERRSLVRALIYPLPDPLFPFLGVHLTRTINGEVEAGPNAVLALAREGYRKTDLRWADLYRTVSYKGFWPLARRYWKTGLAEFHRSLSKAAFTRALQKLVPEIAAEDLCPVRSGVRAQAVSASGFLVDDFVIRQSGNIIHVLNAPSPAATASLAIADTVASLAAQRFSLR